MSKILIEYQPNTGEEENTTITLEELEWMYEEIELFLEKYVQTLVDSEFFRWFDQSKNEKPESRATIGIIPGDDESPYSIIKIETDEKWTQDKLYKLKSHFLFELQKTVGQPLVTLQFIMKFA